MPAPLLANWVAIAAWKISIRMAARAPLPDARHWLKESVRAWPIHCYSVQLKLRPPSKGLCRWSTMVVLKAWSVTSPCVPQPRGLQIRAPTRCPWLPRQRVRCFEAPSKPSPSLIRLVRTLATGLRSVGRFRPYRPRRGALVGELWAAQGQTACAATRSLLACDRCC